ncbi:MAG: adenosylcobinamide-phosphate synthase CbiB [Cyanobacteria bacterium P01_A01_bin.116]
MRIGLLPAAALLDFMVGDPWGWPHPVQAIGKVISRYSQWALRRDRAPWQMKLAGVGLAFLVIGGSGGVSWLGLQTLGVLSPWLKGGGEVVLLASCLAGRSLRQAAEDVLTPLAAGDLAKARQQLALYVGRDTQQLSEEDIRRALLETVSENATDGVFAPLCFAILGAFFNLAAPIAVAYKAASTLDSMVGYRREPYTHLGWFSARLEDGLTWVPCRLSVALVALYSGKPGHVLRLCWRDARADPSPNAGWSECAYAASLGVQLGGENTYKGQRTVKPLLGEATRPITAERIRAALALTRRVFLTLLFLGCLGGLASGLASP